VCGLRLEREISYTGISLRLNRYWTCPLIRGEWMFPSSSHSIPEKVVGPLPREGGNRYRLPGTLGLERGPGPLSVVLDIVRQWFVVLAELRPAAILPTTLSALFPFFSPCRSAHAGGDPIFFFTLGLNPLGGLAWVSQQVGACRTVPVHSPGNLLADLLPLAV